MIDGFTNFVVNGQNWFHLSAGNISETAGSTAMHWHTVNGLTQMELHSLTPSKTTIPPITKPTTPAANNTTPEPIAPANDLPIVFAAIAAVGCVALLLAIIALVIRKQAQARRDDRDDHYVELGGGNRKSKTGFSCLPCLLFFSKCVEGSGKDAADAVDVNSAQAKEGDPQYEAF